MVESEIFVRTPARGLVQHEQRMSAIVTVAGNETAQPALIGTVGLHVNVLRAGKTRRLRACPSR
jgi:hypothetical protein